MVRVLKEAEEAILAKTGGAFLQTDSDGASDGHKTALQRALLASKTVLSPAQLRAAQSFLQGRIGAKGIGSLTMQNKSTKHGGKQASLGQQTCQEAGVWLARHPRHLP